MAKFTDYTQKTKPADADLLLIHDNAGAANKKTPFSGVWSWILDKLASAVISQLETTSKSIIPAINELNSKSQFGKVSESGQVVEIPLEITSSYLLVIQHDGGDNYYAAIIMYDNQSSGEVIKIAESTTNFATVTIGSHMLNVSCINRWWWYRLLKL